MTMPTMDFQTFFQRYVLVDFRVTTWSATRNNKPKDLGLEHEALAADVVRLGSKSVFDKRKLSFQQQARNSGMAILGKAGFQCLGAWAIPRAQLQSVLDELEIIRISFYASCDELIRSYDSECSAWITQAEHSVSLPDFANKIRSSLYDIEYVRKQMSLTYRVNDDLLNNPVGDSAIDTIAEMASKSLSQFQYSMSQGCAFSRKSLRYVTSIKEKLTTMAALDSFIQPAIDQIEEFEKSIPKRGGKALNAHQLQSFMGVLTTLSNPAYLTSLRTANMSFQDDEVEEDDAQSLSIAQPLADQDETSEPEDFLAGLLAAVEEANDGAFY